jgi:hypothetical protein
MVVEAEERVTGLSSSFEGQPFITDDPRLLNCTVSTKIYMQLNNMIGWLHVMNFED